MPIQSYYVMAGYFLTGETASSRGVLKPIRDFDLRKGKFGLGALELYGRYNPLNFGNQVFTGGLADPNLWTNNLYTIRPGSQLVLDPVHQGDRWVGSTWISATPSPTPPTQFQKTNNEAILRMQFYF